jgi:competence protein ComEC
VPDLRAIALGAGAWVGALLVLVLPGWAALGGTCAVVVLVMAGVLRRWWTAAWLAPLAALVAVAGVAALHRRCSSRRRWPRSPSRARWSPYAWR